MQHLTSKTKEIVIKLNVEELSPAQVRLLKTITTMLTTVLTAEEESEYFDSSAELLRKTVELIKKSHFAQTNKNMDYAEQAVEFAIDFLDEEDSKENFDN